MDGTTDSRERHLDRLGPGVLALLRRYVETSRRGGEPVVRTPPLAELEAVLHLPRGEAPVPADDTQVLDFLRRYLDHSTRMHHPAFLAHQVAVPDEASALADLIHGVSNNGMAIYEMGPAAVAVEMAVLDWMLALAGWPRLRRPEDQGCPGPFAGGVLTNGGSLANLTALLAARAHAAPETWEQGATGDLCVLAPPEAHYSIGRAVGIMGLGTSALVPVTADNRQVIRPDCLPAAARAARAGGRRIMALVAGACSTGPGLYDPLEEIAAFCHEEGIWLHVDGAHGASALLSPTLRSRLRGIDKADSLVWDAHKMLRTSALCAAVLVRDGARLEAAFRQDASYILHDSDRPGVDLITRTVECTKLPLGLKLYLNLLISGEDSLRSYVERQYAVTRRFHDIIAARPGFSCPFPPEANILCFRAPGDDATQLNLRRQLLEKGDFYLSSTEIDGTRYLRMTVMGPETGDAQIEGLLLAIEALGAGREAPSS
jgi:L-2,4-diaminobutyrate decarboxylase